MAANYQLKAVANVRRIVAKAVSMRAPAEAEGRVNNAEDLRVDAMSDANI
jgi:hypothetical protein